MRYSKFWNQLIWDGLSLIVCLILAATVTGVLLFEKIDWLREETLGKAMIVTILFFHLAGFLRASGSSDSLKDEIDGGFCTYFTEKYYWSRWARAQIGQIIIAACLMISGGVTMFIKG